MRQIFQRFFSTRLVSQDQELKSPEIYFLQSYAETKLKFLSLSWSHSLKLNSRNRRSYSVTCEEIQRFLDQLINQELGSPEIYSYRAKSHDGL